MRRVLACLLLITLSGITLSAQDSEPVPYGDCEFPEWALALRRGESIFIGSFPITLLVGSLGYDLVRFAVNNFDSAYLPGLFTGADSASMEPEERKGVILVSAGISLAIAVADYCIHKRRAEQDESD